MCQLTNPPFQHTHTNIDAHTNTHICTGYFRSLAPDRASRSINYISAPAIKQGYYQAAAQRPGKARPIKGCCDLEAGARSCDSNIEWHLMLSGDCRMEGGKTEADFSKKERTEGSENICKSTISTGTLSSP